MASFTPPTASASPLLDPLKWQVAESLMARLAAADWGLTAADLYQWLERPKSDDHGDYALPCFRLAKPLRKAPQAIATDCASKLATAHAAAGDAPLIAAAEPINGFLNLQLNPQAYAGSLLASIDSGSYFRNLAKAMPAPQKVMVEYSQPNTHKAFHVGHIRNVSLGDCLGRLFEYAGQEVVMANYLGDEGAHIAKCLWYIQSRGLPLPTTDQANWLDQQYRAATAALAAASDAERPALLAEVSKVLAAIEAKSGPTYELWQRTKEWSLADFRSIYEWFGARFHHWFYESEVSEDSQAIVEEFLAKGVFVEDDGAVGCDLKEDKLGFVILRKRDGNTLYATKDLALARRKFEEYGVDRSIYVVASEQNLHFRQVFKTLERMGFEQAALCYHLSYGMVTLPEGKMSTRSGNTVSFAKLKQDIGAELGQIMAKYQDSWPAAELTEAKRRLAVGAIRFGMIASDPNKDVVFQLEDWLSFEGFSGPYLIYAYARSRSLLSKAAAQGLTPDTAQSGRLLAAEERQLLRYLNDFNLAVNQSLETFKPSILAHHLYNTCKSYNRFLAHCPVLKAPDAATTQGRLALVAAFSRLIFEGLGLLGIVPPERM